MHQTETSPVLKSTSLKKRTRKALGSTNRKQLQNTTESDIIKSTNSTLSISHAPGTPKNFSSPGSKRSPSQTKSKLHQSTVSSISRTKELDEDSTRKQQENLDVMKCKFTATFEEGSSHLRTGETFQYHNNDPNTRSPPPTRFSCQPPPSDTHRLTIGEPGTTFHAQDRDRFTTTKHQPSNAEIEKKFLRDDHERGRLERIRQNNARVEEVTQDVNMAHITNDQKRVQHVQKQQQTYHQAIRDRIARGHE